MISYLRELISLFNNTEWVSKQRMLDTKLAEHTPSCPDEITNYLLYLREHGRQQRERIANISSIFDYRDTVRAINQENNMILAELEEAFNTMSPCAHIQTLYKK